MYQCRVTPAISPRRTPRSTPLLRSKVQLRAGEDFQYDFKGARGAPRELAADRP